MSWTCSNEEDVLVKDEDAFLFSLTRKEKYICDSFKLLRLPNYMQCIGFADSEKIFLVVQDKAHEREDNEANIEGLGMIDEKGMLKQTDQMWLAGSERFKVKEIEVYSVF